MKVATDTLAGLSVTPTVADVSVDAGTLRLSGRIAGPRTIHRGVIVALHGGFCDSAYYDSGPDSLLQLGALLGYLVITLDRPGYGATQQCDPAQLSFAAQTRVLSAAVEKIVKNYGAGAGVVLVGHSIGGMLALCVAAAAPVGTITAVEVSGVGERLKPGLHEMWSSKTGDTPSITIPADTHDQMTLGPSGTYSSVQQARNAELIRPLPTPELISTLAWGDMLPSVAAKVTVPVSITLAEHDNFWQSDADARAGISLHFTATPSIRTELFDGAGHSIELHRNARAYCLRQLAFAEQWLSA